MLEQQDAGAGSGPESVPGAETASGAEAGTAAAVRAGIVGPGGIGALHIDALRRIGVQVTGVAASSPEAAQRHATRLRVPTAHASAGALIASEDVDVVHVCTPNVQHLAQCRAALAAGKHVVAEKPLATSVRGAQELLQLAEDSGRVHAICHNYRYYPMVQALRRLVADGKLGRVHFVHGAFLLEELLLAERGSWMLDPAQMGPSLSLADVGVHWWDLVEHVSGLRIGEAMCERRSVRRGVEEGGEDSAAVILRLDERAIASGVICQADPGHGNTLTLDVIGDRASASWDMRDPDHLLVRELGGSERVLERGTPAMRELGASGTLSAGQPEGHADAFRDLLGAIYEDIRRGAPSPDAGYPTFADGVRGLRVLEALLESARRQRWVAVEG